MAGLFDQLKQYFRDAAPGGSLNLELTPQQALDTTAMSTMAVPVVGDVAGLAADAYRMYNNPEERTFGNAALMGLGALPFVPNLGTIAKLKLPEINISKGSHAKDYEQAVIKPLKEHIKAGNYVSVPLKKGGEVRLVTAGDISEEASIFALDKEGNIVGRLDGLTNDISFHPSVGVEDTWQRKGVATVLYDYAEKIGAKIPPVSDKNAVRTEQGQAFRNSRQNKEKVVDLFEDPFAPTIK